MAPISALFPENAGEQDIDAGRLVLGRYTVLGKLTQGGMAEVYLARQKGPAGYSKMVVVKRVKPNLANDKDFVAMFVNEARLAALINHPNVVQIFDLGQDKRDWFLAMEFLDGRDMLQVGRACRALNKAVPFDVTARIIADACHGLEHAHRLVGADGKPLNLVHRDMSPENILITFEGQVKVVDFGIAKARDNAFRTQAGQIKGKLGYVAPEAILGKTLDGRADIFAIGATLYLFLCGRPAFTGSNPMEIFERSLQPAERPSKLNSRVPPMLEEICVKCLEKEPDDRYRTANELRLALEEYLHSTGRPMGAPQMSQFMKILFPTDKDPTRQRIEQLLTVADLKEEAERLSFLHADTAQAKPHGSSAARESAARENRAPDTQLGDVDSGYEEDPDATAVVPPEQRPDRQANLSRTPSAVSLGSDEAATARGPAFKKGPSTQEPRPSGYHLRSVELASQLDAKERPSGAAEEVEATLTRPPAFESLPSEPAERPRGEMTVELDPTLLRELRAGGSDSDGMTLAPPMADEDDDLDDLDLALDDQELGEDVEVTNSDGAAQRPARAAPPPLDAAAFDASVEAPPYQSDSLIEEPPPPLSAEDIGLELAAVSSSDEGDVTDPDPRRFGGEDLAASSSRVDLTPPGASTDGMRLDFDDVGPDLGAEIIVQQAPASARFTMLFLGMLTGLVVVSGGLWALGELEWMAQRLGVLPPPASAAPADSAEPSED